MSVRTGIRHCNRDEIAEFTFTNLPDAEYEEEKDPEEAVLETRSAGIYRSLSMEIDGSLSIEFIREYYIHIVITGYQDTHIYQSLDELIIPLKHCCT